MYPKIHEMTMQNGPFSSWSLEWRAVTQASKVGQSPPGLDHNGLDPVHSAHDPPKVSQGMIIPTRQPGLMQLMHKAIWIPWIFHDVPFQGLPRRRQYIKREKISVFKACHLKFQVRVLKRTFDVWEIHVLRLWIRKNDVTLTPFNSCQRN